MTTKLKDYQIKVYLQNIKSTSTSNSGGTAKEQSIILPLNGNFDDLGELVIARAGMDKGMRSSVKSAESNIIEKIDVPTELGDIDLLAGELKDMSNDQLDVFRTYIGTHHISNPIDLLNVAIGVDELIAFANQQGVLEIIKDIPREELPVLWEEVKHRDFDHFQQFYAEENKKAINNETVQSLYLYLTFDLMNHSREEIYQSINEKASDVLWTLKKAEENLEGDYDNIDGRIGNNDVKNMNTEQAKEYERQVEMSIEGNSYDGDGNIESKSDVTTPTRTNKVHHNQQTNSNKEEDEYELERKPPNYY